MPIIQTALIGRGIEASRSPAMHQSEAKRLGLPFRYDLIDFDALGLQESDLADVVADVEQRGFSGVNVTHPFKQRVVEILTGLSEEAAAIGAVNTIVFRDGKRVGHNTDCWGFAESVRRAMADVPRRSVLLIGAGGAGKAVAYALMDQLDVTALFIHDIEPDRALGLASDLSRRFVGVRVEAVAALSPTIDEADGLVNATPMGMTKYPGLPIPVACLRRDLWVADIVYFPEETELLAAARARGARTLSGVGMAVHQAAKAFELFTGRPADAEEMSLQLR